MCVAAVVTGIGAAVSMLGQRAGHKADQKMQERQAKIENQAGIYQANRTQDQVDRTLGAARAGVAASGVGLSGSAADVIRDSAEEGALDVAAIRWNSKLAQDNSKYRAKVSGMNAKIAGASAPLAFVAPILKSDQFATFTSGFGG